MKTQHPTAVPGAEPYFANKCIIGVRNPLDVLPSQAARINTFTHSRKLEFAPHEEYPDWWSWFSLRQAQAWNQFYSVIRKHSSQVPTYFVRYEDLVLDPAETMKGLYKFLLSAEDLSGTNCERRIDEVVAMGRDATVSYALKPTTGMLNIHTEKFTAEQIAAIKAELIDNLHYFGYTDGVKGNKTAFYDYSDSSERTQEHLDSIFGFRRDNLRAVAQICHPDYSPVEYKLYDGPDVFPMFENEEEKTKQLIPCLDKARKALQLD